MKKPGDIGPATTQKLSNGPMDMPDRGGKKPNAQVTSTTCALGRNAIPVANLGVKAGRGEVQTTAAQCNLSRTVQGPYAGVSATVPSLPFGGKGKGKKS